jgi:hypothetical protein
MQDRGQFERELFKSALQRTKDCPSVNELEGFLEAASPSIAIHVASCSFCAAEMELLKAFHSPEISASDEHAIRLITDRLSVPLPIPPKVRETWWRRLSGGFRLRPAALALAGALVAIAVGLQLHHAGAPAITGSNNNGAEVLRSQAFAILTPQGDITKAPDEVRWEAATSAARYEIRLLEVDHNELWKGSTTQTSISVPADVRVLMVPAKTLLWRVTAFNADGRKVGESEVIRFRVLQ